MAIVHTEDYFWWSGIFIAIILVIVGTSRGWGQTAISFGTLMTISLLGAQLLRRCTSDDLGTCDDAFGDDGLNEVYHYMFMGIGLVVILFGFFSKAGFMAKAGYLGATILTFIGVDAFTRCKTSGCGDDDVLFRYQWTYWSLIGVSSIALVVMAVKKKTS